MKSTKYFRWLMAGLLLVARSTTALAGTGTITITDSFLSPWDYKISGVTGAFFDDGTHLWDGIYMNQGDVPGATGGGGGTLIQADTSSFADFLTVNQLYGGWENAQDDGFFLYKVVSGDFDVSVDVAAPFNNQAYNLAGLMARAFNASPLGSPYGGAENYVLIGRFDEFGAGDKIVNNVNGVNSGHVDSVSFSTNNDLYLRIQRVGDTFNFFYKNNPGDPWVSVYSVNRADLSGLPMQVGIEQGTFNSIPMPTFFANFSLTGNLDPPPVNDPTGLTITPTGTGSLTYNWTPAAGVDGYLVIAKQTAQGASNLEPILSHPASFFTYAASSSGTWADPSSLIYASGNYVLYTGSSTGVTISGFGNSNNTYTAAVYSFAFGGANTDTGYGRGTNIYYDLNPAVASASGPGFLTNLSLTFNPGCVPVGSNGQATLTAIFSSGDTVDETTDPGTVWSSSDPAVIGVSNGVLTALAGGCSVITATFGGLSASNLVCTCNGTNCCDNCAPPYPLSYTNVVNPGYNYLADNLCQGTNNTLDDVLPNVPDGTTFLVWDFATQSFNAAGTYFAGLGWFPSTNTLVPGEGFVLDNTSGAPFTLVIQGCQPACLSPCAPPANGMSLVGQIGIGGATFTNALGTWSTTWSNLFSCPPPCGARMSIWNGTGYNVYDYANGVWTPFLPGLEVGQSAFVSVEPNSNCCVTPPAGMVAWYTMDEPNGATVVNDIAGFNNQATPMPGGSLGSPNGPTAVAGEVAGGLFFNVNDGTYLQVANQAEINFGQGDLSIDAWVNATNTGAVYYLPIVDKMDTSAGTGRGYDFNLVSSCFGSAYMQLDLGDGASAASYSTGCVVPTDGNWHHIAVTIARGTNIVTFYCDGVGYPVSSPAVPAGSIDNTLPLLIRATRQPGLIWGPIIIDELELFNRALAAPEVQAVYNAGSRGKCKPSCPIITGCAPNKTVACGSTWTFDAPTNIVDYCCTNYTLSAATVTNSGPCPLVVTRTWTVLDACGNRNTCSQTVTVVNTNPPVINCPSNIVVASCTNVAVCYTVTAASACCSNVTVVCTPPSCSYFAPGTVTTVNCVATDCCGNSNTCSFTVTVHGGCVSPPANLVLWLPFDETSGTTSVNLAPGGNNGTQVGGPTVVLGAYVDNSLGFNGAQHVSVPDYAAIDFATSNLTIDAWVNRATNSGTGVRVIVDKRDINTGVGYGLSVSFGNLIFTMSGNNFRDTGTVPADGQWHFVALSLDRNSGIGQFYVDGNPTGTFTPVAGSLFNTNALWVGASPLGGNSPWLGGLDEVELFGRALAAGELSGIYNAGPCGKCKPPCTNITVICPNNKTVQCGSAWTFDLPVASSCCVGQVIITPTGTVTNGVCPKQITQTWRLTDACGHTNTCSQTVTLVDTTPPNITCLTNTIVVNFNTNCQIVIPTIRPPASDNCTPASQLIYTQTPTNGTVVNGSSQYVTVTVTDLCGNSSHCRVLVIGRYPPPVINCPGVLTVTNCIVPNVLPLISATGCNGGAPFVFTQSPLPGAPLGPGSDTITVTVTGHGGSDSCVIAVQFGALKSFLNVLTNTGLSAGGTLLANGAVDPHYTLGPVPAGTPAAYVAPNAVAVTNEWPWLEVTHVSEWIAPVVSQSDLWSCPSGFYTYTNQFVLPVGTDPATASISGRWAADDGAVKMIFNGSTTGNTIPVSGTSGFSSWHSFTITSNFLPNPAKNTILFIVTNSFLYSDSPTGLRVEYTNAFAGCTNCAPPTIVWMSPNQSLPQSGTATFTVNVAGTPPFTYQWYHNGTPLSNVSPYSGVNGPTLTITPVSFGSAGSYYVAIGNGCGGIDSLMRRLSVTRGWPWQWAWWNFQVATNYLAASHGPDLVLSGTNTLGIASGTTLDFGLPNPAGGIATVLDVPPLTPDTSIQVPPITAPGTNADTSYTVIMDLYEPDTSLGTPSKLFQSIACCVSNLGSGGQDGVALTLDAANNLHLIGSAAGAPFDTGPTASMAVDVWNRVAIVVDDPQDGLAVNLSLYLNGQWVGGLAVPTPFGLPVNWNNGPPSLLSRQTNDAGLNGEFYASSIQFHAAALTSESIAGMGSPDDGPMSADDTTIAAQPVLSGTLFNDSVSLTWTGDAYTLQETTDLDTGIWVDSSLAFTQVEVGGGIVTTAVVKPSTSGPSKFYRLVFRP